MGKLRIRQLAAKLSAAAFLLLWSAGAAAAQYVLDAEGGRYDAVIANREGGHLIGEGLPEGGLPESMVAEIAYGVMTMNVGNIDQPDCSYKLCAPEAERLVADFIAKRSPHIVALQEVWNAEQAARILGDAYDLWCEPVTGYDCIAVRSPVGRLEKTASASDAEGCDPGFNVIAATIRFTDPGVPPVRLVNGHPDSRSPECRLHGLKAIFESLDGATRLADSPRTLIMGDFNLDPFKGPDDDSVLYWRDRIGPNGKYYYLSQEEGRSKMTATSIDGRALDHMASNFAAGSCSAQKKIETNDHRGIYCMLDLSGEARSAAAAARRLAIALYTNSAGRVMDLMAAGAFACFADIEGCDGEKTLEYRDKAKAAEALVKAFQENADCLTPDFQSADLGSGDGGFSVRTMEQIEGCFARFGFQKAGLKWELAEYEIRSPK